MIFKCFEDKLILDWLHFGRKPWQKIERIDNLDFPSVIFNADQASTYDNLRPNNVYNFSLGNFAIKRALQYLNHQSYQRKMFECQILPFESAAYIRFQNRYFPDQPITVIRFKVESYHKSSGFNFILLREGSTFFV